MIRKANSSSTELDLLSPRYCADPSNQLLFHCQLQPIFSTNKQRLHIPSQLQSIFCYSASVSFKGYSLEVLHSCAIKLKSFSKGSFAEMYKHCACLVSERVVFFYREKLFATVLTDLAISLFIDILHFFHIYKIQ